MKKRRNMRHGYAGKQYDAVTGMYDYGFRDYSPASARFTTPDPIRDGRNWFSYVNNDPVNFVDLWGLFPEELEKVINKYLGEEYDSGLNDCDIWAEKVLLEAYPQSTLKDTWGAAANYTSAGHREKLNDKLIETPPSQSGTYIVFQIGDIKDKNKNVIGRDAIHSFLIEINEDKTVDMAQMTRNPEGGKTADGKGYSELLHYDNFDKFDTGWGELKYYKYEAPKSIQNTEQGTIKIPSLGSPIKKSNIFSPLRQKYI